LAAGRPREAADVFGRLLLRDARNARARRGLERAEAAGRESERDAVDLLERAAASDDPRAARAALERALSAGADRDRALALLDRLDRRAGLLTIRRSASRERARVPSERPIGLAASRRALAMSWCVLVLACGASAAAAWEPLMDRLVETPAPAAPALATSSAADALRGASESALVRAQDLLYAGDTRAALRALDGIGAQDPAWPFARQLRARADAALRREPGARP
jgi:hypothetical protein